MLTIPSSSVARLHLLGTFRRKSPLIEVYWLATFIRDLPLILMPAQFLSCSVDTTGALTAELSRSAGWGGPPL